MSERQPFSDPEIGLLHIKRRLIIGEGSYNVTQLEAILKCLQYQKLVEAFGGPTVNITTYFLPHLYEYRRRYKILPPQNGLPPVVRLRQRQKDLPESSILTLERTGRAVFEIKEKITPPDLNPTALKPISCETKYRQLTSIWRAIEAMNNLSLALIFLNPTDYNNNNLELRGKKEFLTIWGNIFNQLSLNYSNWWLPTVVTVNRRHNYVLDPQEPDRLRISIDEPCQIFLPDDMPLSFTYKALDPNVFLQIKTTDFALPQESVIKLIEALNQFERIKHSPLGGLRSVFYYANRVIQTPNLPALIPKVD